jgi:hypothetical protein
MSEEGRADCRAVEADLEDLALGMVDSVRRTALMDHVGRCAACQHRLDQATLVVDRLLLDAAEVEPPDGFESRVLERLAATAPAGVGAGRRTPRPHRWRTVAAASLVAVALTVVAAGGVVAGRALGSGTDPPPAVVAAATGVVERPDGTAAGRALLLSHPRPMVVVTIDRPRPSGSAVRCELVTADGRTTVVGSWSYTDIAGGAWAVGIDAELLDAVAMNIRAADGTLVATAALT